MTLIATPIDVEREVVGIRAELEAHADASYAAGSARTVPSLLPSHAVRVPEVRKIAAGWWRANREVPDDMVLAVAEVLWKTTWREERLVAIQLVRRSKALLDTLSWEVIERWSAGIDNWEHVDHLATDVTSVMLQAYPDLLGEIECLAGSEHSWQRRLAIVTLINAARRDPSWRPILLDLSTRLAQDRGATMRKAVAWAQRVLRKPEAQVSE